MQITGLSQQLFVEYHRFRSFKTYYSLADYLYIFV